MAPKPLCAGIVTLVVAFSSATLAAVNTEATNAAADPAGIAFFEKSIRPVLVDRCYECHSTESGKSKGGLLLDTREALLMGGDSGAAVVPGNPKESLLLEAIRYQDKDLLMPPKKEGGKLADNIIADFEKWIQMGAPDPRGGSAPVAAPASKKIDLEEAKRFWAFQSPKEHTAPAVKDAAWPRTDVDRFILAAQEAKGLHPVADADKRGLIRRVYFDLIGLPPSPEQVDAFLKDSSSNALEKVVDGLLASSHFGERWGRHWLDVARYAESTGKERNFTMPSAWRYRDYVIDAFNAGKPYDQFIREQVAGDLLSSENVSQRNTQLIATGFLALGPKSLNEKNKEQFRADLIDEQIDVTSRAVLGLTVACARCHDHKFDPISQKDYYGLAGIFRSTQTHYGVSNYNPKKPQRDRNPSTLLTLASEGTASTETAATSPSEVDEKKPAPGIEKRVEVPANFEQRLAAVAKERPKLQQRLNTMTREEKIRAYERLVEKNAIPAAKPEPAAAKPAVAALKKKRALQNAVSSTPAPAEGPGQCMGVSEARPGDARLLVRGEISQPSETVPRGFVSVLGDPAMVPAIPAAQSGRLQLAEWLTAESNPLTARVAVNRVWHQLFGRGLVETPDNFGLNGSLPTHPELLDHLAVQFMRDGWSIKQLIRQLVLSRTYQLSNATLAAAQETDPDNRLLWRATPRRLDAEAIRDSILAVSGTLQTAPPNGSVVAGVGEGYVGRGIRPEIFTNATANYRSVYLPIVRDCVPEMLDAFDFAEPSLVVAARDTTNVPSQALFLMNSTFVREQSTAMARRILNSPLDHAGRIRLAYDLALGRPPTAGELARAESYLLNEARGLVPVKAGDKNGAAELSWATFCQALFASAEFRFLP